MSMRVIMVGCKATEQPIGFVGVLVNSFAFSQTCCQAVRGLSHTTITGYLPGFCCKNLVFFELGRPQIAYFSKRH